jgi:hypothetical protein
MAKVKLEIESEDMYELEDDARNKFLEVLLDAKKILNDKIVEIYDWEYELSHPSLDDIFYSKEAKEYVLMGTGRSWDESGFSYYGPSESVDDLVGQVMTGFGQDDYKLKKDDKNEYYIEFKGHDSAFILSLYELTRKGEKAQNELVYENGLYELNNFEELVKPVKGGVS